MRIDGEQMSYMSQGTKAVIKPPILTIPGFPGAGKSTLAGLFPKPAFIQAEDSQTIFESVPGDKQPFLCLHYHRQIKKRTLVRNKY